jgi:ATP-binding cassette subfamily C exporter for protease/lipase
MNHSAQTLRALWPGLGRALLVLLALTAAINVLTLTPTLYMLQVFDRVMVGQNHLTLLFVSAMMVYLWLLLTLGDWLRSQLLAQLGIRFDAQVSPQVFEAVYHRLREDGQLAAKPLQDVAEVRSFVTGQLFQAFLDAPFAVVFLAALFLLHPTLGWVALCLFALQVVFAAASLRVARRAAAQAQTDQTQETDFLRAKLTSMAASYPMGMLPALRKRWDSLHNRSVASADSNQALSTALADVSKFLRYTQQAVSLATGAILTLDGAITPASMIAANVLMSRALAPADQIVSGWRTLQTTRAALTRLLGLLGNPSSGTELEATPLTESQAVELECRKISVQLPGRAQPALKDVDLLFPAGSLTMMMGPSGSGKSTLASVLVGGMASDRVRGQLWVNGEQRLPSQRGVPGEQVGYLPQEVELFNASVSDNIARLGPVDGPAVVAAAREAGLHEMILELPQGYDTRIGEAGQRLSGGMRHRMALARALYGHPRWLVLDEPDANLDQAGEMALQHTLQAQRALGTTIVLISHRTHWLNMADRLVVLAHGEVQASGPKAGVLAALSPSSR